MKTGKVPFLPKGRWKFPLKKSFFITEGVNEPYKNRGCIGPQHDATF